MLMMNHLIVTRERASTNGRQKSEDEFLEVSSLQVSFCYKYPALVAIHLKEVNCD